MADYTVTHGDTAATITIELTNSDGSAVDLTAAVGQPKLEWTDGSSTVNSADLTIAADKTTGVVSCPAPAAMVASPGFYYGKVLVTWPSSQVKRYPDERFIVFEITKKPGD